MIYRSVIYKLYLIFSEHEGFMQHILTAQLDLARTMFGLLNLNKYLAILILAYLGLSHAVNAQEGIVYSNFLTT